MHTLKNENNKTENLIQTIGQHISVFDEKRIQQNRLNKTISSSNRSILQRMANRQDISTQILHPLIQLKLKMGQPIDKYEQEADRIADEAMRMPEPLVRHRVKPEVKVGETFPIKLQQKAQRQEEHEFAEKQIQPKTNPYYTTEMPTTDIESNTYTLWSSGKALSKDERKYFEPRFGNDFQEVRIHTGR